MMANTFTFIGCIMNGVICGIAINFVPFLLRRFDGLLDIVLDVILSFAIIAGSFTLMWYVSPVRIEKVIFLLWVLGIALGKNYILSKE